MAWKLEIEVLEDRNLTAPALNVSAPGSLVPITGTGGQTTVTATPSPLLVLGLGEHTTPQGHDLSWVGGVRGNHNETLLRDRGRKPVRRRKRRR